MERRNKSKAAVEDVELHDKLLQIQKALAAIVFQQTQLTEELLLRDNRTSTSAAIPTEEHASMIQTTVNNPGPGEARSVFLVVDYYYPRLHEIYEVKLFKHTSSTSTGGGEVDKPPVPLLEPLAKFSGYYLLQSASISSKLYLLHQDGPDLSIPPSSNRSFGGYVFDTETRAVIPPIPPTIASKPLANVVSANGKLYYLAAPSFLAYPDDPCFERYDPDLNDWEPMPRFPFYNDLHGGIDIIGDVVCYDVILFSLCNRRLRRNSKVIAFHESRKGKEWNQVEVDTSTYAPFYGRAAVVGNIIYALNGLSREEIIALSFRMEKGDDGGVAYSLSTLFKLQGLKIASPPLPFYKHRTEYLVHLGNNDFFYVNTGRCKGPREVQYLCITMFQIVVGEGGTHTITTLHSTVHPVDIKDRNWFMLQYCFTS